MTSILRIIIANRDDGDVVSELEGDGFFTDAEVYEEANRIAHDEPWHTVTVTNHKRDVMVVLN